MNDPFNLSQYTTSFNKLSDYTPRTFQFADFDGVFATIAEAIRIRQTGVAIGFNIPENAFINVESYDTTTPSSLSDSVERFQDAIRELVQGNLIEEYGKLPNCNVYAGFFHYESGLPIVSIGSIAPNGLDFTTIPDPADSSNIVDFAAQIGIRINELVYSLNILTLLHGKMYVVYNLDTICNTSPPTSFPSPPPPPPPPPPSIPPPAITVTQNSSNISNGQNFALGSFLQNTTQTFVFSISNTGSQNLVFPQGGIISGGQLNIPASPTKTSSFTLTPGSTTTITVTINSSTVGTFTNQQITLSSNDPVRPVFIMTLSFTVTAPVLPPPPPTPTPSIEVSFQAIPGTFIGGPGWVDHGTSLFVVPNNSSQYFSVADVYDAPISNLTIKNTGTANLTVPRFGISTSAYPNTSATDYAYLVFFNNISDTQNMVVPPGGSVTLQFGIHRGIYGGPIPLVLTIQNTDSVNNPFIVNLTIAVVTFVISPSPPSLPPTSLPIPPTSPPPPSPSSPLPSPPPPPPSNPASPIPPGPGPGHHFGEPPVKHNLPPQIELSYSILGNIIGDFGLKQQGYGIDEI